VDPVTTGVVTGGRGGDSTTGHTVVEIAMVFVVTEPYGQFVTVGGHLVTV